MLANQPSSQQTREDQMLAVGREMAKCVGVQPGDKVLIWFDSPHRALAEAAAEATRSMGGEAEMFEREYERVIQRAAQVDVEEVPRLVQPEADAIQRNDRIILFRNPENPEAMEVLDDERRNALLGATSQAHQCRVKGEKPWTLTLPPTKYDASIEGIPLDEYVDLYLAACNQPWEEIKKVQAELIELLNAGSTLTFKANSNDSDPRRRTDITMSIEGMTFSNSTVDKNYPGSEVFSAPVLTSVNGQIFAEGDFVYQGLRMKNIYLRVVDGRIEEAKAEVGDQHLQSILSRGEGARFFGEVAIGTNRGLTRRLINPLLVEKVAGSFHMAIGHCYSDEMEDGRLVRKSNGNDPSKTSVHWDVTVLMHPSTGGGEILLDGKALQRDGKFVDPKFALLNPVGV